MNEYETPMDDCYEAEIIALAEYLDTDIDMITVSRYDNTLYETDEGEFLILDDEDADKLAEEYILDSLWAFNADFIINHTDLPYDAIDMIRSYQNERCEDANDTIYALINDIDEFVLDAINTDGRGHFMNSYDGDEMAHNEWFIYRMN